MDELNNSGGINRRKFIETSVKLAGAAFIMGFGGANLIRASSTRLITNTIPSIVLNNGIKMPALGFGTLYLTNDLGVKCVSDAISVGYRLIDTATIYGNEESVGEGIKKSGIQREELFITSKVWVDDSGYEKTKAAFNTSLKKLGLDYLDLYLIHRPRGDVKGSWKAMEELYKDGKIRAIGVSNFNGIQIEDLLASSKIIPAVNQIESHVFFQQNDEIMLMKKHGIQAEAWSPFAQGRNNLFTNKTLTAIGKKYNKTNAQVSLRWQLQRGVITIPRTSKLEHMIENLNIFDFELDNADMQSITELDLNTTQFPEWE